MKVETHKDPTVFTPIRLIIDIESKEEFNALMFVLNRNPSSMTHDQGKALGKISDKLGKA